MIRFTLADLERANAEWQANCGPAALAAICGLTLEEVRCRCFPAFPGFTNVTLMRDAVDRIERPYLVSRSREWPLYGLALIQFEGPWTQDSGAAWARRVAPRFTHWIGVDTKGDMRSIWDINAMSPGGADGWLLVGDWTREVVPDLVASRLGVHGRRGAARVRARLRPLALPRRQEAARPMKNTAFYRRLGHLVAERFEPDMCMSRAIQICRMWRMHIAWHLANALGWRSS